jgi:hypothetical protein
MALPCYMGWQETSGACYLNTFVPLAVHSGAIVVRHKHFYTQTSRLFSLAGRTQLLHDEQIVP